MTSTVSTAHCFESTGSTQTLAEGLAEYFEAQPHLKREGHLVSAEALQSFALSELALRMRGAAHWRRAGE